MQVVTLSAELSLQGFFKLIVTDLMGETAITDDINVLAPSTINEETEDTIGKSVSYITIIQCATCMHSYHTMFGVNISYSSVVFYLFVAALCNLSL
jgi:hypothetical protein